MNRNDFEKAVYDPENGLNATDVAVLLWYAKHKYWANEGSLAWGAAEKIASQTRRSKRSVDASRPKLEELGWLVDSGERHYTNKGRPVIKYDLAIGDHFVAPLATNKVTVPDDVEGLCCSSDGLCCSSEGTLLQNQQDFVAPAANEYVMKHALEDVIEDGDPSPVPGGPVDPSPSNIKRRFLNTLEVEGLENKARAYSLNQDEKTAVRRLMETNQLEGHNFDEKYTDALRKIGREVDEW